MTANETIRQLARENERLHNELADAFGRGQLMAIAAVRYCLGRQSYIVSDCVDWLEQVWATLTPETQTTIKRDVEEAFEHDEKVRYVGAGGYRPLGMDCDRAQWERARRLWE